MIETQDEMVTTNKGVELLQGLCEYSELMSSWIDKEEVCLVEEGEPVTEDYRDENYIYCEDTEAYQHNNDVWHCEISSKYYYMEEYRHDTYCGITAHDDELSESDEWRFIQHGRADGYFVSTDEITYCEDIEDYVHDEDATFCEVDDNDYYDTDYMPCEEIDDDCIKSYHSNKYPTDLNSGYHKSLFSVGFEIEKTEFIDENGGTSSDEGDWVGDYDLFEGFETDSSCGVEAVTKILPLGSPRSEARKEVFDMFDEAANIINSPSDTSCGGHITVSYKDLDGDGYDMADRMRKYMSLVYALYRFRLKRTYCSNNKGIKKDSNTKYSPVNIKNNLVELRLPSRVKDVKQLKLRYDLMYKIMYHSMIKPVSFQQFLKNVRHIVVRMYGSQEKVDEIYLIAEDFRKYLVNETVSDSIEQYINND